MERQQDDGRIRAGAPQDSGKEGSHLPTMPFRIYTSIFATFMRVCRAGAN